MMTTTTTILLALLSLLTPVAAIDGHWSLQLRLSALTDAPVRTTVVLHGVNRSATVTPGHTTNLTIDYPLSSDQVLDNSAILLDVSTVTDADFNMDSVELTRDSPRLHSVHGLVQIVSSRSQCAKNYYGPFCALHCAPTPALHWECDSEGRTKCAAGWGGHQCRERACSVACVHGHCEGDSCRCRAGFAGAACDRCVPAVGCAHGACSNGRPLTCACSAGWTGPLCNIERALCDKGRSPCAEGSKCIVKAPGKTVCICPEGKTGPNCDIDATERQCPCKNGGICRPNRTATPECTCPTGFTGPTCELPRATVIATSGTTDNAASNSNLLLALQSLAFVNLGVLLVGFLLIALAIFLTIRVRAAGVCGPTREQDRSHAQAQKPKPVPSSISLLMPTDCDSAPSSPAKKGDDLFTAAQEHAKKAKKFDSTEDTVEEARYTACPAKSTLFVVPDPPTVNKDYEFLPV